MKMCGYHLRCLNYENKCSECMHREKGENKDYLYDALNVWAKGKEAKSDAGLQLISQCKF